MESRSDKRSKNAKDSERLPVSLSYDFRGPQKLSSDYVRGKLRTIRRVDKVISPQQQDSGSRGVYRIFTGSGERASALKSMEGDIARYDALLARAASGESGPLVVERARVHALSPQVWDFVLSVMANVLTTDAELEETAAYLSREYLA